MKEKLKTRFDLEKKLVNRHISIETSKMIFAGVLFVVGGLLAILNLCGLNVAPNVIIGIWGSAALIAASSKVKSLKEILAHN